MMSAAQEERGSGTGKGLLEMKRFTLALAFVIVTISGITTSPYVSAQEILLEGPLAGAPAVRKIVQFRKQRFSIGPQFSYIFRTNYMHNLLVGARLEYNFVDWLGLGVVGYYSINVPTKLTEHISNSRNLGGTPTTPTDSNWPSYTGAANFEDQVALLRGLYLAQLGFVPFRGKMSMFEKIFVAIDGTIFVGGGIVHFEERAHCDALPQGNNDCQATPTRESQIGGAFTWGLGFMAYFNDWFAVNLEYRMTPFKWNVSGTDESGQAASEWEHVPSGGDVGSWETVSSGSGDYPDKQINDNDQVWELNQSIALGFIFYLPLSPKISN